MAREKPHKPSLIDTGRLQHLLDAVADRGLHLIAADGTVANWNAGAARLTGYAASEIVGEPVARLFSPEDRASGEPERMLRVAREAGRYEQEGWRVRKDGTRFRATVTVEPFRGDDGEIVGFAHILSDASERIADQRAAAERDRQFRMLVQGVVDYAIFMLDVEGNVATWNAGAQRLKGYAPEEIIGRNFSTFYTEDDRRAGIPRISLEKAARDGKVEIEGWRVRQDGSRFFASVIIDAIRDEGGRLVGFAKVTRDITERKTAEEKLEATRTALLQAQKMEALGQLTGGVAHDFNNLLTVIINNADLLLPFLGDRDAGKLLDGIRRAAARGATLTHQLLAFARRQPLRPKPHRINALIGAFEAILCRACGEALDLRLDLTAAPNTADIDASQFEAALLNLIVNARDAMPKGGALTIRTAVEEIDASRAAGMEGLKPGRHVVVAVSDTGEGMAPEVLRHVFEPFFTTKEPGKGSGLGLSQVFGFVKQSGGHVEIESRVGAGTTVTLYLPAVQEMAGHEAERPKAALRPTGSGTVLVVEDDPDVLDAAIASLRSLGYDVLTAGNGPAALQVLQRGGPVDVLFSDVVMPKGMSGVELAHEARRLRPGLKVLLASGYPKASIGGERERTDGFAFIGKPYRLDEIAETLRRLRAEA